MTLFDLLFKKMDEDVWDVTYDVCVTVCLPDEINDDYDKFCCEICKKVKPITFNHGHVTADWTKLILDNMDKFKEFSKLYWQNQYDDIDDFVYEWINEIHWYMAGYVSEDFYPKLVSFVETLE